MKTLGPIVAVVVLLLCAAIYYNNRIEPPVLPAPYPLPPTPTVDHTPPAPLTVAPAEPGGTPAPTATSTGTLKLESALSHAYLALDTPGELMAAIDVSAIEAETGHRPPLNIALVIDRSGSMVGAPMDHARQAALRLVDQLEAGDRLAIVSFSREVRVDFPSNFATHHNREAMRRAIRRIGAGGATNIGDGYLTGLREVKRAANETSVNRIVLLTDGAPNVGTSSTEGLLALVRGGVSQGVSMTAMGFGHSYNEDLMAAMADEGGGQYYYIGHARMLSDVFEREMETLATTVARNAVVNLQLGPGVQLDQVLGFPARIDGRNVQVRIGDFAGGQTRSLLVRMKATGGKAGEANMLDVQLGYDDLVSNRPVTLAQSLTSVVTTDAAIVENHVNVDVISRAQKVEAAASLQTAMDLYSRGDSARAEQVLAEQEQRITRTRSAYRIAPEAFDKVSGELSRRRRQVKATAASAPSARPVVLEGKASGRAMMQDSSAW